MDNNYLKEMFINQAKPALDYHNSMGNGQSGPAPDDTTIILVDENGSEVTAVLVDEKVVFDAEAEDIREGKVAATDDGVTVGTHVCP